MERSSKRGKIPQQDWPAIIKRYEAGETLASIARTYDCSPPAISYIVSRSRARDGNGDSQMTGAAGPVEPQLVKGSANDTRTAAISLDEPEIGDAKADDREKAPAIPVERSVFEPLQASSAGPDQQNAAIEVRDNAARRNDNGWAEPHDQRRDDLNNTSGVQLPSNGSASRLSAPGAAPPQNNESRRTLRLSLSQEHSERSGAQHRDEAGFTMSSSAERMATRHTEDQQRASAEPRRQDLGDEGPAANGGPAHRLAEPRGLREGSAFIDHALRERVDGDITAFLAAFDAALAEDTPENRIGLREATDRLLRAGARTRIELERLEARAPLPPRDGQSARAWRPR